MKATLVLARMGGVALAVWAAPLAAKPEPEPPIKIPDFEVWESPVAAPGEDWRYTRVGRFEVLSKVSDRVATDLVKELLKFHHALSIIYPKLAQAPNEPLGLILADSTRYRSFVSNEISVHQRELSHYFYSAERSMIVADADSDEAVPLGSVAVFTTSDNNRQLSRQYLRYLVAQKRTRLPAWLEEGLAQTITDIEIRGTWLNYGKIFTDQNDPGQLQSGDPGSNEMPFVAIADFYAPNPELSGLSFKYLFAHQTMLSLDELFHPPTANDRPPSSDSAWAKQAYAFVHFCLFGNKLRYREPLVAYLERLQREPESEALFTTCFGIDHAQMRKELRAYVVHTAHKYQRYPLKPEQLFKETPVVFRDATESETGLLKGEALQLAGHDEAALDYYRQAYLRGARAPDFLAGYAASCARAGDNARAKALVNFAIEKRTTRPSAYVLQAQLRFDAARTAPAGTAGKLDDRQLAAVLEPLFAALKLQPSIPEAYELIARAWLASTATPKPQNLAVLDEGIRHFPREVDLLTLSFELYRQVGDTDKATSIARLGTRLASDSATKAHFEQLAQSVVPAANPGS